MTVNDDKDTVIIDFNSIKKELEENEALTTDDEIEFNSSITLQDKLIKEENEVINEILDYSNIYKFTFQTNYFESNGLTKKMQTIDSIDALNTKIRNNQNLVLVFYYNDNPKLVNKISQQLNLKFKSINKVIIAKNLSADKAQQHQKSKYAAEAYLNEPFDKNKLDKTLMIFKG